MSNDTLRDDRQRGWFWVEDALFDEHAPALGVYGVAAYCLLARLADAKGVSWPSYSYMAKRLKISRRTAMRAVDALVGAGLVEIEEQYEPTPDGNTVNKSNRYTLKNLRQGGAGESLPSAGESPGVVQESHWGGAGESPKGNTEKEYTIEGRENTTPSGQIRYLDKETHQISRTLMSIEKWDKNEAQTLDLVSVSKSSFPRVDVGQVAISLSYKMRTGAVQYKKPSKAFSNWVAGAAERVTSSESQSDRPRIRAEER